MGSRDVYIHPYFIFRRKYLGIVFQIDTFKYFVPLSSPKKSDYEYKDNKRVIRKSIVPIMRITSKDINDELELNGTLRFSNMIPVIESELIEYDVNKELDSNYKILIFKELNFIRANFSKIEKSAKNIYKQKTKNFNIPYLKNTVDFKLLEEKSKGFSSYENNI